MTSPSPTAPLHPQLAEIAEELEAATRRLHALARAVPEARWSARPAPERWSAAECVEHLNLTTRTYLPLLRAALDGAGPPGVPPRRHRRDLLGWLLWRTMGPPVRRGISTPAAFVPQRTVGRDEMIRDFEGLQAELLAFLRRADGYPLGRLRIPSPFAPRLRYNVFSALSILPRHQHRHLWQAEQAG